MAEGITLNKHRTSEKLLGQPDLRKRTASIPKKLWDTQTSTFANPGIAQNCFYHAHASDTFDRRRIIYVFIHTWAEVSDSVCPQHKSGCSDNRGKIDSTWINYVQVLMSGICGLFPLLNISSFESAKPIGSKKSVWHIQNYNMHTCINVHVHTVPCTYIIAIWSFPAMMALESLGIICQKVATNIWNGWDVDCNGNHSILCVHMP